MNSEYSSLMKNDTWELVPRPEGINVVGSRWIFKIKRDADGAVEKFKRRVSLQRGIRKLRVWITAKYFLLWFVHHHYVLC